jgi:Serine carboxypeptidase S28
MERGSLLITPLIIFHIYLSFTPDKIHANAHRTNIIYGEMSPNVRNVYSTHGELDPWRAMGVQKDINVHSPTFILPREYSERCFRFLTVDKLSWNPF